jgi:hypothetical protein
LSSAVSIDSGGSAAAEHPLAGLNRAPARRSRWWVELLAIAWLAWAYDAITNLTTLHVSLALANARGVLHVEHLLHIDPELTLDRWLAGHHTVGLVVSDYYDNAHFIVTLAVLGWLWWRRADLYRPLRNTLVLVNVLGFVVFWLYPVAPPRMLDGFIDVVASTHAVGSWHTGALASHANQVAAMPSLHIAWAAWCTLALWRASERPIVRVLAVAYPSLTGLAVLATGNHFLLDIVGGVAVLAVSVLLVGSRGRIAGGVGMVRRRIRRRATARYDPAAPALRMSQSCYEVQDTVK